MNLSDLRRATIIQAGMHLSSAVDHAITRWSRLEDRPLLEPHMFSWVPLLESNWPAIRAEADSLIGEHSLTPPLRAISPDHQRIATDERWKCFFLWGYGERSTENCARCPVTAGLLEEVPDLLTALFSILEPGTRIPRHTGPTKAILTCHLGLQVPGDAARCGMRVAGTEVTWEEGRMIVFDDMYAHEVWNDTDEYRVILMLHVKRPAAFPGSLVRDAFLAAVRRSPFIQDARRNVEAWRRSRGAPPNSMDGGTGNIL